MTSARQAGYWRHHLFYILVLTTKVGVLSCTYWNHQSEESRITALSTVNPFGPVKNGTEGGEAYAKVVEQRESLRTGSLTFPPGPILRQHGSPSPNVCA